MSAGLLEKESTGGATARVGFEYQDAFVLQHLPSWLAQGAFSHVVSEAIGDVEVCYFAPAGGIHRVMYEAKNYALTASEFWKEIERFKNVFETSPTEYVRFALVCRDYNSVTAPLLSKISRLRGVGSSYPPDSVILANGRQEVLDWCMEKKVRADLAAFALDRVDFISFAAEHADSAFSGELEKHLPHIDLSGKQVGRLRDNCKAHIARSSSGPVYRRAIEADICDVLGGDSTRWTSTPCKVYLPNGSTAFQELGLDIGNFDGPARGTLSAVDWHALSTAATTIGGFVKDSTLRRGVALDGKHRMSTACALGYAFSATRGFTLVIDHNGFQYRTDLHKRSDGTFFNVTLSGPHEDHQEGIVCIGFPTPVGADIGSISAVDPTRSPRLVLESTKTIDEMTVLNLAVAEAKSALTQFRSEHALSKLHLLVKAPSVFAMVLGQRLNGLGTIQLYDWIDGRNVPTVLLNT